MRVNVVGSEDIYVFSAGWGGGFLSYRYPYYVSIFVAPTKFERTYEGYLEDGDKNAYNERPCTHYHLDGDVTAVPDAYVTVKTVTFPVLLNTDCAMSGTLITYRKEGYIINSVGPSAFNSIPNAVMHLPNYEDSERSYSNCWYACARVGENGLKITMHREYQQFSPWRPKVVTDDVKEFSFDFPNRRYRELSRYGWTGWIPMQKLQRMTPYTPSPAFYDFPYTKESFENVFDRLARRYVQPNDSEIYGDLVRRCANDAIVIPTNSIGLSIELREISATLRSMFGLVTGKVTPKLLASAYLSYKYGLRLTVLDLKTVYKGLTRVSRLMGENISRARAKNKVYRSPVMAGVGDLELEYNYKIIHLNATADLRDALRSWFNSGLFPSLTNAWDLIPLSFVLDWFLSIEKYLDAIDANTYWSTYRIVGTTYSKKETYRDVNPLFQRAGWSLVGNIQAIRYIRYTGTTVHKPSFFEDSPRKFKNYAELTSLIIVNTQ